MTIRDIKTALRMKAIAQRATVDAAAHAAFGSALARSGLDLVEAVMRDDRAAVAAFLPIRGEPDLRPLLSALAGRDRITALPVTPPRGEPLRFRAWGHGEPLVNGRFGTVEPSNEAPEVEPSILFIPLAAFDRRGFRLGYGAGYYDGALQRLRRLKPFFAVGVAFAIQEVDAVPTEPHDERLDAVLTEDGLLTLRSP